MALPLSSSTTYVATTTPSIKAQDLNDLQKYLSGLYSNLYSIKGLTVDGTGGAAGTAASGQVLVQQTTIAATPLILPRQTLNAAFWWVDRNGFPGGHYNSIFENWHQMTDLGSKNTSPTVFSATPWQLQFGNSGGSNAAQANTCNSTSYPGRYWTLTPGTNANDYANLLSTNAVVNVGASFGEAVLEFDFEISAVGANTTKWQLGWVKGAPSAGSGFTASNYGAWFEWNNSVSTHWQCVTSDGASATLNVSSPTADPSTGGFQRLRIEWHAVGSQFGSAQVLFFVNEVLVATNTTHLAVPNNTDMSIQMLATRLAANAVNGFVGQIKHVSNYYSGAATPL
jgi:hypothetical protein